MLNDGEDGKGEIVVMSDNAVVGSGLSGTLKAGIVAGMEGLRGSVDL